MAKYSICVVDDVHEDALNCIKYLKNIDVIGEIHLIVNPFEVLTLIKSTKIDIIFLDIEMPDATGFEIYNALPIAQRPILVLMTNHDHFAIEGFRINAADYILKPVNFSSVSNAITKALSFMNISVTLTNLPEREYGFYPVKDGGWRILMFGDIICIEGDGNYITAHLRGKIKITIRKTMHEMVKDLPASYFMRIHQSYIVNMRFAWKLKNWQLYVHEITIKDPLPVSRSYRVAIISEFRKISGKA